MKKKTLKVWETRFVVEGLGDFPFDMLRYDSAFPMTERDAYLAGHTGEMRRVAITSRKVNDTEPTAARWKSFGWTVVGVFNETVDAEDFRDQKAPPRGQVGM